MGDETTGGQASPPEDPANMAKDAPPGLAPLDAPALAWVKRWAEDVS